MKRVISVMKLMKKMMNIKCNNISKDSFEILYFTLPTIVFFFLKDNLCEFHLREQFFCRNKPINPVLIVRKLQYDYRAF